MTLIDKACWERGCSCHDDRVDGETVEVVLRNDVLEKPVGRFAKFTDGIWREVTDGSAGVSLYTTPPLRNDVLEEVAKEFDSMKAFGDTSASFAAYVRGLKR
jgi:hypothetical protein